MTYNRRHRASANSTLRFSEGLSCPDHFASVLDDTRFEARLMSSTNSNNDLDGEPSFLCVRLAVLARGMLTWCLFTVALDPRLDFFAGTVAGAFIPTKWVSTRQVELTPTHVCTRFIQEWPH